MKKLISIIMLIILTISLCACNNNNIDTQIPEENPYLLTNGLAPSEMVQKVNKFIVAVYMPYSQNTIDNGIEDFKEIATDMEIEELKNTVGGYNSERRATVSNLNTLLCTPDNSFNKQYKMVSTFTVTLGGVSQNMLIEFGMNNNCKVDSHSIWVNNNIT